MKILLVTCNRSIVGGIERYLQVLIPALLKRGHEVAILCERSAAPGAPTIDPPGAGLPVWLCEHARGTAALERDVADWAPDVIYAHGLESLALEDIWLDRYPAVWYAHVYMGTCTTGRKCHVFPQEQPCDRRFGPMCLAMHYPRRCGGLNPWRAWQAFQVQSRRQARLPDYRSILVASRHMYREYERHGVSPERLHRVPLPVTDSALQDRGFAPKMPEGELLFMGRLTDMKGVHKLIEAVPLAGQKLGRNLALTVAGDGPERAGLEILAGRLGVPVRFTGWVDGERKTELMRDASLLAVPSVWPEPFGLVGIEAGCLSLPAVGYQVGGIPDWLISGVTGELAASDPPTAAGLADAIVRALANPEHYSALRKGAWEHSRQFTMERHMAQVEPLLEAVCKAPRPGPQNVWISNDTNKDDSPWVTLPH